MTQISIQDTLLNEQVTNWFNNYLYLGCGTSSSVTIGTETDLYTPKQIGATAANRNKVSETGTTSAFVSDNVFVRLFKLTTIEPNVLPVNLRELGLHKTEADNNDMGSRIVLNVNQTKDNTVAWNLRFQGRVSRLD